MDVKPGFKQTDVGAIPEDWEVKQLGAVCEISAGRDLVKEDFSLVSDESNAFPVYSNALKDRGLYGYSKSYQYEPDKITVTARGDIGHANYRDTRFCAIGRLLVLSAKLRCDLRFVTEYINNFVNFAFESTGVPQLTAPQISKYEVVLPPTKAEQEAIAKTLCDADALIASMEQLLAKKRDLKQGAMQQLLQPKDAWIEKKLGELATLINGRAYSLTEWETRGTPVIRLQNLTGRGDTFYYSTLELPDRQYCNNGDLLFMWSATFGPIIWRGPRAIFHYHIWKIECRLKQLSKEFLYHLLSDITERLKSNSSSGGTMLHLTKSGMEAMKIAIPTYDEQQSIGTILSDMDTEIEALEAKLSKAHGLKQAMMQELLTGRIRLL